MFLLVLAYSASTGPKAVKRLCVCVRVRVHAHAHVCVCACGTWNSYMEQSLTVQ